MSGAEALALFQERQKTSTEIKERSKEYNQRQEEHYKLARIRVDLPNALDHEWEIDVTKSRARPPEKLRRELTRIGEHAQCGKAC